jgi:hypothetical protein
LERRSHPNFPFYPNLFKDEIGIVLVSSTKF